jgi:hypothetical protein
MKSDRIIRAATTAYFSGLGYYSYSDYTIPGTEIIVDVVSIQPILKELKPRLKRGFAPAGIMQHLIGNNLISLKELVEKTGYSLNFIGSVLEEANKNGWVELDFMNAEPVCRNINYVTPAKEAILTFIGTDDVEEKIDLLSSLKGCFNKCYFVFPYFITAESTEVINSLGCGVMKYIEELGAFVEIIPAEYFEIEDKKRFALIAENILFLNIREKKNEII